MSSDRSNARALLKGRHVAGDFTLRATVENGRSSHWIGLEARGYRLLINNQLNSLLLQKKHGSKWLTIAQQKKYLLYVDNSQVFELGLSIGDNEAYGYLDDRLVARTTAPGNTTGPISLLGGWQTNVVWSDVRLSSHATVPRYAKRLERRRNTLLWVSNVEAKRADNIYWDDEEVEFDITIDHSCTGPCNVTTAFRIFDVNEKVVHEQRQDLSLKPNATSRVRVRYEPQKRGSFKIGLYYGLSGEDLEWILDAAGFSVLPPPPSVPIDSSYFGAHVDAINLDWHLDAAEKIGVKWLRFHDTIQWTWWPRVRPKPHVWQWRDDDIDKVSRRFGILGTILWTPEWLASRGSRRRDNDLATPPTDPAEFEKYVESMAARYQRQIRYWEVWNEPHNAKYWAGSPEAYGELLEAAAKAIRKGASTSKVIGGGGMHPRKMDWHAEALKGISPSSMDIFSIHYLETDAAQAQAEKTRGVLSSNGFRVPIWNSEANVPSTSFFDQSRAEVAHSDARYHYRNACFELVRMYMANIANGVVRVFYHHMADPWRFKRHTVPRSELESSITGHMWDEGRTLRPIGVAHAALAHAIGSTRYKRSFRVGKTLSIHVFQDDSAAVAVIVPDRLAANLAEEVPIGPTARFEHHQVSQIDFMGNHDPLGVGDDSTYVVKVSKEPTYIRAVGTNSSELIDMVASRVSATVAKSR